MIWFFIINAFLLLVFKLRPYLYLTPVDALLSAEAQRKEAAIKLADSMESLVISIRAQVSEEGTLYGAVGTREIADSLIEKGFELEKSAIRLPEGVLKEVGEYAVDLELHPEVVKTISIEINAAEEN